MEYTANYNLAKPEANDVINPNSREGYNDNFDTLDTTLKSVSDKANANEGNITTLQGDVTTLQGDVTTLQRDYIVEQGTDTSIQNTTWTYRKWNSGFVEAWFKNTKTITSIAWSGAGLTNTNRSEGNFDFPHNDLFIEYDELPMLLYGKVGNGFGFPVYYRTSYSGDRGLVSYAMSSNSSGSQTVVVWGYVTGRWKS